MLEEVVFSSAEVSGVGRRRGPAVAVRLVVRGWRRGRVGGGGKLHHAARVHHVPRPSEFRSPHGTEMQISNALDKALVL